jgi:hypothetical protein
LRQSFPELITHWRPIGRRRPPVANLSVLARGPSDVRHMIAVPGPSRRSPPRLFFAPTDGEMSPPFGPGGRAD